jgi:hypothetical protein
MKKRWLLAVYMLLACSVLYASTSAEDYLRSIGKINVVFAVILTIFAGLIVLLIWMERRLSRIEKLLKSA